MMVYGQEFEFLVMPYFFGQVVQSLQMYWKLTICLTNTFQKISGIALASIFVGQIGQGQDSVVAS